MLAADLHTRVLGLLQRGRICGEARFHCWPGSTDPSERENVLERNEAHFGTGILSVRSSTRWGITP
jgi:hypothetical protein